MRPDSIRAGTVLSLVLFAAAAGWRDTGRDARPTPCPRPVSVSLAETGHTRAIRCDGPNEGGEAVRGPARVLVGLGIDPNRADAGTLEALPGIGPARAAAIVATRERVAYRAPADLLRVSGIGPVTLRRMRDWLTFPDARRREAAAGSLADAPQERVP